MLLACSLLWAGNIHVSMLACPRLCSSISTIIKSWYLSCSSNRMTFCMYLLHIFLFQTPHHTYLGIAVSWVVAVSLIRMGFAMSVSLIWIGFAMSNALYILTSITDDSLSIYFLEEYLLNAPYSKTTCNFLCLYSDECQI